MSAPSTLSASPAACCRRLLLGGALLLTLLPGLAAPENLNLLPPRTQRGHGPLRDWLLQQEDAALQKRRETYEALKTPAEIAAHQQRLRAEFVESLGGFPERTPLNARKVGEIASTGFHIEKILYESQPGFVVPALLYLPDDAPRPLPVVLMPCGHSGVRGKAGYQAPAALFATHGVAVFCFDPIGQGERRQLPADVPLAPPGRKYRYDPTVEHTTLGVGAILLGHNLSTAMIWDGMRAVDYLETRPDLDAKHIFCVGNSGGGMMTSYLLSLEERLAGGGIGCFMSTSALKDRSPGPGDIEQNIFGQYAYGLDMADFLTIAAPRPTIILSATRDYTPIAGTWSAFRDAKRLYTRLGVPERINLVETDAHHGFSQQLREGAVHWVRRWLCHDDRRIVEANLPRFTTAELTCTPTGRVLDLPGARSILELYRSEAADLAPHRTAAWAALDDPRRRELVRRVAGLPALADIPAARVETHGTVLRDGVAIEKLLLVNDGGLPLPALRFHPARPSGRAILWVDERGKAAATDPHGTVAGLVAAGADVLAIDASGFGELAMDGWRTYPEIVAGVNGAEFLQAYMLGRSFVGLRARDILVAARAFQAMTGSTRPPELIATGEAGIPALHAAAVAPSWFSAVQLNDTLDSWQRLFEPRVPEHLLASTIHGVLRHYDLPDLLPLAGRVEVIAPRQSAGRPLDPHALP
jgi:dienelactone hydrolase